MESGEEEEVGKIMLAGGVEDEATPGAEVATWDIIRLSCSQFIMTRYCIALLDRRSPELEFILGVSLTNNINILHGPLTVTSALTTTVTHILRGWTHFCKLTGPS